LSQRVFAASARVFDVFEKLVLLTVLSAMTLFTLKMLMPQSAAFHPVALRPSLLAKFIEASPPPPPVFDREAAMTSAQLLDRWKPYIAEAARKFDLPQSWIRAVLQRESGGRTMMAEGVPITSSTGAVGIMQLMPGTYNDMRAEYDLGDNPADPHDSVIAGAAYLKWLHHKYGYPNMFAAYNDGPANFDKYLAGGRTLPVETVAYLSSLSDRLGDAERTKRRRGVREARISRSYSVSG
jgi:soluble lytic murein transglycosylase-like protein